jgi:hypothetical protein
LNGIGWGEGAFDTSFVHRIRRHGSKTSDEHANFWTFSASISCCFSRLRTHHHHRSQHISTRFGPRTMTSAQQNELTKAQSDRPDEPSRDGAFRSLLTREDLSDVTLRASDGALVIANRCILASRSSVFLGMLYGPFKESSTTVVEVGYEGKVIEAIVNYIYTDKVPESPVHMSFGDEDDASEIARNLELMRFLVALIDASEFFALSALRRMIETSVKDLMCRYDRFATLFMAVCAPDCDVSKVLRDTALGMVKKYPRLLIQGNKSVVAMIHPRYLEDILKQERLPMTEHSCFQLLQAWATAEVESPDDADSTSITDLTKATTNDWQNNRKRVASEMTSHIDLAEIDPTKLSTMVTSSGLVTTDQLFEAYKRQALKAPLRYRKRFRSCYDQCRGMCFWKESETTMVLGESTWYATSDSLQCPVIKSGVHKWSIKVLEGREHGLGLSFAKLGDLTTDCCFLYEDRTLRSSIGHNPEIEKRFRISFQVDAIVSFTLDLDQHNGRLTASINGKTPFEVFSDLRKGLGENDGFVPSVKVREGRVEFLGFEETP